MKPHKISPSLFNTEGLSDNAKDGMLWAFKELQSRLSHPMYKSDLKMYIELLQRPAVEIETPGESGEAPAGENGKKPAAKKRAKPAAKKKVKSK